MRKIIMYNLVSIDGYFAGKDGDISWHTVDDEFNKYAVEFIGQCDTALFGRVTYDLFADFWPNAGNDPNLSPDDHAIAQALSDMRKVVVTHQDLRPEWQNTEVWPDIDAAGIEQLKQQDGKNIVIYGSGTIVKQLTDLGLIDEYRIMVAPVILGEGRTLFDGCQQKQLKLAEVKTFASGNVSLGYV